MAVVEVTSLSVEESYENVCSGRVSWIKSSLMVYLYCWVMVYDCKVVDMNLLEAAMFVLYASRTDRPDGPGLAEASSSLKKT